MIEDPIIVNERKELETPTFFKKDVEKISLDVLHNSLSKPTVIAEGTVASAESGTIALCPYNEDEFEDGLYIFTCGNSYAICPLTKAGLKAQLPIRVAMPIVDSSDGSATIGVLGIRYAEREEGNFIEFIGVTSNTVYLPQGWGFKLLKV